LYGAILQNRVGFFPPFICLQATNHDLGPEKPKTLRLPRNIKKRNRTYYEKAAVVDKYENRYYNFSSY